jgi:uncharacterized protein YdeI (YjbR/CyaY-like superfamily)
METPTEGLEFANAAGWRSWLETHHATHSEAWLIIYKVKFGHLGIGLEEAVKQALCFGWIDGILKRRDEETYFLRFSPRRTQSVWSIRNVRRAERLILEGKMTSAGLRKIKEAMENGQWEAAHLRENTDEIPERLRKALSRKKGALAAFRAMGPARKKQLLHWLQTARRSETERKRIQAIVDEVLGA